MYLKVRRKVYTLLHPELGGTILDRAFNAFIITLILANIIVVMLETVPSIYDQHRTFFFYFDSISVAIFTVEYLLRVWSSTEEKRYSHRYSGRLRFIASPAAIMDLLVILPFYLHIMIGLDLRMLQILRLFRFVRLFRLTAYMKATRLIVNVFKATYSQLLLSLALAITLIIISSSLVYFAEHDAQPEVFTSIPATLWWSVVTLTTVGYGDMIPVTAMGKFFASLILFTGVALFALPAGILTAGFLEESRKLKQSRHKNVCPHCHMPLPPEFTDHPHNGEHQEDNIVRSEDHSTEKPVTK